MITVEHLVKNYGEVHAVKDISFEVEKGELFAFLGLNGAGKSTTINILSTVLPKTSGKVTVDGLDLDSEKDEIKRRIGIVFQGSVLDDRLTVGDNLTVRASFYGLKGKALRERVGEVTELFGLSDILSRPYGKLSGGQRRRADVARGLPQAVYDGLLDAFSMRPRLLRQSGRIRHDGVVCRGQHSPLRRAQPRRRHKIS